MNSVAIIGGGASGVLMAVQVLRQCPAARVELFESRADLGAGVAYGTEHPGHLLNVPAEGMSALADAPGHFVTWLAGCRRFEPAGGWTARSFVPRRVYRDYLAGLVAPQLGTDAGRVVVHRTRVIDLVEADGAVSVVTADGARIAADAAVIATGNEGPAAAAEPWRRDFWSSGAGFGFPAHAAVAIIGTGLSMVDSVVTLLDAGHSGTITAISRRGLVPRPHDRSSPRPVEWSEIPDTPSVAALLRWLRDRASATGDWRAAVDSLRPHTQAIWARMSRDARRRFLRHARPWWDVHRHRMAPEIHQRIQAARDAGQLRVLSARIDGMDDADGARAIRIRRRGRSVQETIGFDCLVDCRGHSADAGTTANPLLRRLFERGTARPDALKLGLDVTQTCAVVGREGQVSSAIFAVGPITIGRFWEIVAIPDIRVQVAELAGRLAAAQAWRG